MTNTARATPEKHVRGFIAAWRVERDPDGSERRVRDDDAGVLRAIVTRSRCPYAVPRVVVCWPDRK